MDTNAMIPSAVTFASISRDIDSSLARIGEQPTEKREIEYYRTRIRDIKSVDALLEDERLFRFAMRAFGLSDMTYAKAFMRKVIEEGVDSRDSFANSLNDSRYRDFAGTFNFKAFGSATTSFERAQEGVIEKFKRQVLEELSGRQNESVRLALYFERRAGNINNYFEVLADPALAKVMRVAFGLPDSIAAMDIEKQRDLLESRMPLDDLKAADGTKDLLERFLAFWDLSSPPVANAPGILLSGPSPSGVDSSLLLSIQQLKGRR